MIYTIEYREHCVLNAIDRVKRLVTIKSCTYRNLIQKLYNNKKKKRMPNQNRGGEHVKGMLRDNANHEPSPHKPQSLSLQWSLGHWRTWGQSH